MAPELTPVLTRGWLDSRYRRGLSKQVPLKGGMAPFGLSVPMKPTDWTFEKGHFIGLGISTEIDEWSLPKPYPCPEAGPDAANCAYVQVDWQHAKTRLILPVVGHVNTRSLFSFSM